MKIFLVIANLATGGAERVMSELANNWVKDKSKEVHIVLLTDDEIFYDIDENIKIHSFNMSKNKYYKSFSIFSILFNFRKLVKVEKPDVILSFMNKYNIFTLLALHKLNQNIVVSERDGPTEVLPKTTVFLRNLMYRYAKGIICQTQPSKEFIIKETTNNNVVVIPNPIKKVNIDNNIKREKIILNVGRLVNKKGQIYLLESFSKLNRKDWKLVILGEGELRKDLENRISELSLNENVFLKGTVKNVDKWLNKASIYAFPSTLEGFPNALAEAMSAGLPCVSFDCDSGPSDLILDGENGFLVNVGDIDKFTSCLEQLIESESLRKTFSSKAIKTSESLDSKLISHKYLDFLKKCMIKDMK